MQREAYYDNARFLLILLVVFGHLLTPFTDKSHIGSTFYWLIYTFHMPAFILISGYFAKGFRKKGYVGKIAKKLVIPYFMFQAIYAIYYVFIHKKDSFVVDPFDPQWSLWFLLSLFFWNLLLYVVTKFDWKWTLPVTLVLGVLVGYISFVGNYLSLSRTFVFLPIFLAGFYMKHEHFKWLQNIRVRIGAISVISIGFLVFYFIPEFNSDWLLGSKSYEVLNVGALGGLYRSLWYIGTFIITFSFLSLVPSKQYFFTDLGGRTLYVYLLHGFIIQYVRNANVFDLNNWQDFVLLSLVALGLTFLLSSRVVYIVTQPIIEFKTTKLRHLLSSRTEIGQR
ncbi:acyltransferase family protein [Bacillus tianshenii]|nr:acyltransferase family protein [Bacillus tianshenii]